MKRILSVVILIVSLFAIGAMGQELPVPNSSFEKAGKELPEGWGLITKAGKGKITLDSSIACSGKNSLLLSGEEPKDKAGVVARIQLPTIEQLVGKTLKASLWYRTEKFQGSTMFKVEGVNKESNKVTENYTVNLAQGTHDQWQRAELSFAITNPNTAQIWINIYMFEGSGKIWLDDVKLEFSDVLPGITFDFEKDKKGSLPEGWKWIIQSGEASAFVDDSTAKGGKHSLKLNAGGGATVVRVGTNPIVGLTPQIGKRYQISVWCRSEELFGDLWLKIEFVNKERNNVLGTFFLKPQPQTSDWYLLEGVTDKIPEGTAEFWLNINLGGRGTLWLDEIKIEEWTGTEADLKQSKSPLPVIPAPSPDTVLQHPSLLVKRSEVEELRARRNQSPFKEIATSLLASADLIFGTPLPAEPDPYPEGWEINHWRVMRGVASQVSGNMEKLSFAYLITGNGKYAEECKRWIMLVCSWDVNGTTSTRYHDDLGRWLLWKMSYAVDWIYDTLTAEELAVIRPVMLARGNELFQVQVRPLAGNPYDSHAVSAACYLTCAALTLSDLPEAKEWLDFSVGFYSEVYPPWGGKDGGWSEGLSYWKASMTEALEAAELLKVAGLVDVYKKDWYQNTVYYKLYFDQVGKKATNGFGDAAYGGNLDPEDYTAVVTFAGTLGNPNFKWYANQINSVFTNSIKEYLFYYRYGDKYAQLEAEPPYALPRSRAFYDIGWVALHSDLISVNNDVNLFLKSSPQGSISHSHGEQNSFTLTAWGEPLVISGGYYDWYGSPHHYEYTRHSRSKNTILVNGEGQHPRSLEANGKIVDFFTGSGYDLTVGEAGTAYGGKLDQFDRKVLYCVPDYFIMVDYLKAPSPANYNWLLHTLSPMKIDEKENRVALEQHGVNLEVNFLWPGKLQFQQTDKFYTKGDALTVYKEKEEPPETEMPQQYHLAATTTKAEAKGNFVTVLYPYKEQAELKFTGSLNSNVYQILATGKGRRDVTLVSMNQVSTDLSGSGMEAQGKLAAATWQDNKVNKLFLEAGTSLKLDGKQYLTASSPATLSLEYLGQGGKLVCKLKQESQLTISLNKKPSQVVTGGDTSIEFAWKDDCAVFRLPEGEHTVTFREHALTQSIDVGQIEMVIVDENEQRTAGKLKGRAYENGDQLFLGSIAGIGVYQITVPYRRLASDAPCDIQILAGPQALTSDKELPQKDGWNYKVFHNLRVVDNSNLTVIVKGNGLGQNFCQLGTLQVQLTGHTLKVPSVDTDEKLLEHGIVIMAADKIHEEVGLAAVDPKVAAYKQSTIMNWGPDNHKIVWKFTAPKTDEYVVMICGATNYDKFTRELKIDGKFPIEGVGLLEGQGTGGWGSKVKEQWKWFVVGKSLAEPYPIKLEQGEHTIELTSIVSTYMNLNYILLLPKAKYNLK